jgi:predicted nuclease with TOPRIM domain
MKNFGTLSIIISFALICSCQKQDSAAEQELAQRKTELDARENRLDERMNELGEKVKALDERVKVLAENQKGMANAGTNLNGVQSETSDPAQEQAERERIQQLAAEMRARIADPSRLNSARADKERRTQEQLGQRQRALDGSQTQKQRKSNMFSGAVFPTPATPPSTVETTAPTPSPATEAASPNPSPTPE